MTLQFVYVCLHVLICECVAREMYVYVGGGKKTGEKIA